VSKRRLNRALLIFPATHQGLRHSCLAACLTICLAGAFLQGELSGTLPCTSRLVVDECHHLSAVSFEAIAREAKARYVLGLSATVAREDGHHPIIFMQCGPVRHRVDARKQAAERPFGHKVAFRQTNFRATRNMPGEQIAIQELYAQLAVTGNDGWYACAARTYAGGLANVP
jgi:hypothetical protein